MKLTLIYINKKLYDPCDFDPFYIYSHQCYDNIKLNAWLPGRSGNKKQMASEMLFSIRQNCNFSVIRIITIKMVFNKSRQESNLYQKFRKLLFYPLNYETSKSLQMNDLFNNKKANLLCFCKYYSIDFIHPILITF